MSEIGFMGKYSIENLTPQDRVCFELIHRIITELLSEQSIGDYVNNRKEVCNWGEIEAITFSEKAVPFLTFLKEQAEQSILMEIIRTIDNYNENEKGVDP